MTTPTPTTRFTVQNKGIFCGLPTFPASLNGQSAVVFGANGISGYHMLRVLSESPERWTEVTAFSRRPQMNARGVGNNVRQESLDLMQDPKEIAEVLVQKSVKADYVFFFAYIQPPLKEGSTLWSDAEEMCRVNGLLLQNALTALSLAKITPKRILLQTGAKNYGWHHGPAHIPCTESDPRVIIEKQPNFYYTQYDILQEYCTKNKIDWNVIMPSYIIGAVPDAAMNVAFPLAVYAAVQEYRGGDLVWPSDTAAWEKEQTQSSALMNGYLAEWAVLTKETKNEMLNAADGSPFTWGGMWREMGEWYRGQGGKAMVVGYPEEDAHWQTRKMQGEVPRGFGSQPTMRYTFTFVDWASDPDNAKAWDELVGKHNLVGSSPFLPENRERIFSFLDFGIMPPNTMVFSLTKARKLGWCGFVDSMEAYHQTFREFADMKMVPQMK